MCEAFFEWQPMKASRLRCNAAGTCPSLQGGGEPVWALFVPPPRFRCRVHAIEISASGHGWLSLAVKIKRQCRRSTSGGVRGDAGLPPAMGLRNRSVVLAGDIVGGQGWARGRRGDSGARVQGALQGRVLLATLRSTAYVQTMYRQPAPFRRRVRASRGNDVRVERCPQAGRDQTALWSVLGSHVADFPFSFPLIRETLAAHACRALAIARPRAVLVQSSATRDRAIALGHRARPRRARLAAPFIMWENSLAGESRPLSFLLVQRADVQL